MYLSRLILFSVFVVMIQLLNAQQWIRQRSNVTVSLNDVCFADTLRGWVVGRNGTILNTNDGGNTWIIQESGVTENLWGITCIDSNKVFAVGDSGVILYTSDGGESWIQRESGTDFRLWKASFVNSLLGWVVGAQLIGSTGTYTIVLHTSNGGEDWSLLGDTINGGFVDINFVNELEGWMAGTNAFFDNFNPPWVFHTIDGGSSWEQQSIPNNVGPLRSLCFVDSEFGWATGYGMSQNTLVYHTTNGGDNWTSIGWYQGDTITFPIVFNDVFFNSRSIGWLVGAGENNIYYSSDSGYSWVSNSPDTLWGTNAVFSPYPGFLWAVTALGEIWKYNTNTVSISSELSLPRIFSVSQNYPNPFNASTVIPFSIYSRESVKLEVYDVLGHLIMVLVDNIMEAGEYRVVFDEISLSSGVYFYVFNVGNFSQVRKMVLVK